MSLLILCFSFLFTLRTNVSSSKKWNHLNERIVNGIPTKASDFPFIASVSAVLSDGSLFPICGGSILRKEYPAVILTAAHCLVEAISYKLRVDLYRTNVYSESGNVDNTQWNVLNAVYNEGFNVTSYDNDIALLFLDANLSKYSEYESVKISNTSCCDEDESLIIAGYGYNAHNGKPTETLQYTELKYVNRSDCNLELTEWAIETYNISDDEEFSISENQICAIGNDTDGCQGDSGGPMMRMPVENNEQIGIISTGFGCNEGIPSIYTDVSKFYGWIYATMDEFDGRRLMETTETTAMTMTILDTELESGEKGNEHNIVIGCVVAGSSFCCCFIMLLLIHIVIQRKIKNRISDMMTGALNENSDKIEQL